MPLTPNKLTRHLWGPLSLKNSLIWKLHFKVHMCTQKNYLNPTLWPVSYSLIISVVICFVVKIAHKFTATSSFETTCVSVSNEWFIVAEVVAANGWKRWQRRKHVDIVEVLWEMCFKLVIFRMDNYFLIAEYQRVLSTSNLNLCKMLNFLWLNSLAICGRFYGYCAESTVTPSHALLVSIMNRISWKVVIL